MIILAFSYLYGFDISIGRKSFFGRDQVYTLCDKTKWRRGGLMVSALVTRSSGPGSTPGQGHCVVFLGKTLDSHSASLHPGV